jgi:predicted NBD/HSP70 family sugar kinase
MNRTDDGISAERDEGLSRLGGGANQSGARAYNERLALSLIRRNGPLPKAELARLTGLSAQTLSIIMRRLESDGLVVAQEPMRGRIGQPSVPYALNPAGAMSFGVKIGRRSTDVVLCDFLGAIRARGKLTYAYPEPERVLAFVAQQMAALRKAQARKRRIIGAGIAMPFELWKWADQVDAPAGALDGWRDLDIARDIQRRTGLRALIANDATAACGAELARIERGAKMDFLYFFVGSFIGGGVVLNGAVYAGTTANAGAVGSMPVPRNGKVTQLIEHASLISLERALQRRRADAAILQDPGQDWASLGAALARWIEQAAEAIALAIVAGVSIIDVPLICIDGAVPADVREKLVGATRAHVAKLDLQGLSRFEIVAGTLGADARALGGAMLPLVANYASDTDVLLKSMPAAPTV